MKLIRSTFIFLLLLSALSGFAQTRLLQNREGVPLTNDGDIVNKYSKVLSVPADSITNRKLYALIERFSSTPYKFGGSDVTGVDCSGFTYVIEKEVYDATIPRSTIQQASFITAKNVSDLQEGDLVFLKFGGSSINHVGVYLQNGYFVHATSNMGLVVDNLTDPYIQQRFMSCGAVPGAIK
ncbi:MAG TPA: C40 family peptidase [Mucilaginibacter sp.]|jgi:cell wall-associated NlpC family hydrolase|nr:C40 family peptidase [Mucilaginibacter sp.]